MYILFKWTINTKKGLSQKGYFLFYVPKELADMLNLSNIPSNAITKEILYLEASVKNHTRKSSQVRDYSKLRKKSVKSKKVLAQSQNTPKSIYITLRFPTIFRHKHISNILYFLQPKSSEWIKYCLEGGKEIYPHDYGLIQIADIVSVGNKDRLIAF